MFFEDRFKTATNMLSKNEANVYVTDASGHNSLQLAYESCIRFLTNEIRSCQRFDYFQVLLESIDSNFLTDKTTTTQLLFRESYVVKHAIVSCGNVELAETMLKNGYPVHLREPERYFTALDCAIIFAKFENAKLLVKHGASINTEARYELSPLHYYTKNCQDKDKDAYVLKRLLERYFYLQCMGHRELTDVEWLFKSGNRKTVRTALQSNINFNLIKFHAGKSFLHLLLQNEDQDIIYIIVELYDKFGVNARNSNGSTLLWVASQRGLVTAVEYLLKNGADAKTRSLYNCHPILLDLLMLHGTKSSNVLETDALKIAELLLRHGADAQIVFHRDLTILSYLDDGFSESMNVFTEMIIAHLALLGTMSKTLLTDRTRADIESKPSFKTHFDLCTRQLEEIRNVGTFYGTVSLFDLLIGSDEKIVVLTRNQEFLLAFNSVTEMLSHGDSYYLNTLRKRIAKAVDKMEQERRVVLIIESLTGLCCDVIYKIVSYLNFLDLQDLCKYERVFLSKK